MRKLKILFLLLVLDMVLIYSDTSSSIPNLSFDDFTVLNQDGDKIFLKQSIDSVVDIIGEPIMIEESLDTKDSRWNEIEYKYDGFSMRFYKGWEELNRILITTTKIKTLRNLSVGESSSSIFNEYNLHDFHYNNGYYYGNLSVEDDLGIPSTFVLRFFIIDGVISSIELSSNVEL